MCKIQAVLTAMMLAVCFNVQAAESPEDILVMQATISLSAFRCAAVTKNPKENQRLLELAINNGRTYLTSAKSNSSLFKKAYGRIPFAMIFAPGPSVDFALGAVFAYEDDQIHKNYPDDTKLWRARDEEKYREMNCALIR